MSDDDFLPRDYVRCHDVEEPQGGTVTEWGVEITAVLLRGQKTITKVFQWRNREQAEYDCAARSELPFVKTARVVSRQVTTTPWEAS